MNKIEILNICEKVLGRPRQTGLNNYAFFCPFCNHYKRKLELNLDTFNYHCWTCTPKLGGKNFYYLFRKLPNISKDSLLKIKEYTNTPIYLKNSESQNILRLPSEFRSMKKNWDTIYYRHANVYLMNRGITQLDVAKYNIGYCEEGEYGGRIIVPSYDADGNLNYFSSRTFLDNKLKYKNPKISRDIVAFENLINWNYPIVLVEGVMDAIAIKRNAIPLLGKTVGTLLKKKLELNKVKDIYICLDNDARQDAIKIAQDLLNTSFDRNVYLLKLDGKDPSEIGFVKMCEIIKKTPKFNFQDLIYTRLFE